VVVPVGLSDANAIQRLYFHSGRAGDGTASIAEAHRPSSFYTQHRFIPVFKGDDVITEFDISEISALKIDVEGAELEVLRGFHDTISNRRPFIVFEVLHNFLVATGEDLSPELAEYRNRRASEISQTLKDLRYYIYNVRGRHLLRMDVIKPEVSSDLSTTDYLAIPKESDSYARMRFSEYFEFHDNSQIQTSA
jgi:hypothetical protein